MDLDLPDEIPTFPSPDEIRELQRQLGFASPTVGQEHFGGASSGQQPSADTLLMQQAWLGRPDPQLGRLEAYRGHDRTYSIERQQQSDEEPSVSLYPRPPYPQPLPMQQFPASLLEAERFQSAEGAFRGTQMPPSGLPKQPSRMSQDPALTPETYPAAECSQEEVLQDRDTFHATLQAVHEYLAITEKIPRVGGRELDLHMLYCNVCSLGGCETVTAGKLWREAAEPFNYPETITSVSYVLRKAYISLLWDYEQVYRNRLSGQRIAPPSQRDVGLATTVEPPTPTATLGSRPLKRRRPSEKSLFPGLPQGAQTQLIASAKQHIGAEGVAVGSRGAVTLDSRFDAGYFVTVKVGRQEFQGMLYYPPPEHTQAWEAPVSEKPEELSLPKPNKTPFNFFSVDARIRAKQAFPELSQTDITRKVGEMWQKTSDADKAPYVAISNHDKHRYQAELDAHNYRLAAHAASQTAGQALQAVAAAQVAVSQQSRSLSSQTLPADRGAEVDTTQEASDCRGDQR